MVTITRATVKALLDSRGARPRRSLGQNFLADPNTARRIVTLAEVGPGDAVLEIGPGLGSLTLALVDRGADVLAVEIDPVLAELLAGVMRETPDGSGRVAIEVADACTVPWLALLGSPAAQFGHSPAPAWTCVSNLPYNVAVPVVVRLLEEALPVERILVMVQREVGERLAARPGDEQYGAVSVKVAYYAEASVVGTVSPSVFVPRPKVDSALVRLRRRAAPPVSVPSEAALFALVRAGFAQRRKMLRRSLQPVLGGVTDQVLAEAGIPGTARAEVLGLEDWASVARSAAAAA